MTLTYYVARGSSRLAKRVGRNQSIPRAGRTCHQTPTQARYLATEAAIAGDLYPSKLILEDEEYSCFPFDSALSCSPLLPWAAAICTLSSIAAAGGTVASVAIGEHACYYSRKFIDSSSSSWFEPAS